MIYVDRPRTHSPAAHRDAQARRVGARNGGEWCHLMADTPDELRAFAKRLGLDSRWAQGDHYDLTPSRRAVAVRLGAVPVEARDLVRVRREWREKGFAL